MAEKYDILLIKKDDVLGTYFDDKYGPVVRVRNVDCINTITWDEIWQDFLPDLLSQNFADIMNKREKIEMSQYLREYFKNKFNN